MAKLPTKSGDYDPKPKYERGKSREYKKLYNYRWMKYSKYRLTKYPLCANCLDNGITKAATCTDHTHPHKGNVRLFWDKSNHASLCTTCHNKKTAREGAFGK